MWVLVAAFLLLATVVATVSFPLVAQSLETYDGRESEEDEYSERDALLEAMSELEQANETGKISEKDYKTQKLQLQKQYLKVVEGSSAK